MVRHHDQIGRQVCGRDGGAQLKQKLLLLDANVPRQKGRMVYALDMQHTTLRIF